MIKNTAQSSQVNDCHAQLNFISEDNDNKIIDKNDVETALSEDTHDNTTTYSLPCSQLVVVRVVEHIKHSSNFSILIIIISQVYHPQ